MSKKVTVYSTNTCPWCHKVKQYLKDNSIEFQDFDVSSDRVAADAMIKESGQMGVPVVNIEGKIIVGFDKEAIKKELGI